MNFESPFSPSCLVLPTTLHIQPLTPTAINNSKLQYEDEPRPQANHALSILSSSEEEEEEEDEDDDDDEQDNLSLDNGRESSNTPPLTTSYLPVCNNNKNHYTTLNDTYLHFIEPRPVPPPSYYTLPPGGCPRFPVSAPEIFSFSTDTDNYADARPPAYRPAIYKIGVVARKIEWINAEELSPNRSWKYYIIELNSTQINFYNVPSRHELQVVNFRSNPLLHQEPIGNLDSVFTNHEDYQFYRMVKSLGLLESRSKKHKTLDKSYSLQNAKIGLATDYKKRANVLRMKVEDEQILLNFNTTQDVINWNLLLNVGKDVSIDITDREMPKYRTVPRRRRRRNTRDLNGTTNNNSNSSTHNSGSVISNIQHNGSFARLRSVSDPNTFKGRFSRLKSKISGYNKTLGQPAPISVSSSVISTSYSSRCNTPIESTSSSRSVSPAVSPVRRPPSPVFISPVADVERSYSAPNLRNVLAQVSAQEPRHENEVGEEEEEEDDDDDYDHDRASLASVGNVHEDEDLSYSYKWNPVQKKFDMRKYHRDCLRCIKPLFYS